jgi:hypothetical protein
MLYGGLGLIAGTCVALAASLATAAADCTCRANGRNYQLGQTACLSTPQGFRLATCGMVLNNTSWRISSDGCVAAEADTSSAQLPPAVARREPPRHGARADDPPKPRGG